MPQHQNHISPETDDRLYEQAMFGNAGDKSFLGDPEVVGGLVADYCQTVRTALEQRVAGVLPEDGFIAEIEAERDKYAAIFRGQDAAYTPMIGWNDVSLPIRLKVELGPYWQQNRDKNDDDPVKCLFAWLCWAVFDAVSKAQGDPDLEAEILSERTGSVIRLLIGADQRR